MPCGSVRGGIPGPVYLSGERVDLRVTEREDVDLVQRARSDPAIRAALTHTEPRARDQVEEGRLRDHVFLEGAYRDVLFYWLLREE